MSTAALAANAYRAAQGLANRSEPRQIAEVGGVGGADFGAMLRDAIGDVAKQGRSMDRQSAAYASGKSNMVDVVTAVAETQAALETLVAVRDKVISAYEEILKMPI